MFQHHKDGKTRVLLATDHAGYNGRVAGVGRYLSNVLPRLDQDRFHVSLIILREAASLECQLRKAGIHTIQLNRGKFDPLTLYDFLRIIRQATPHVLHLHQYGSSNFGRIAGRIAGVPTILHAHGPDLHYPAHQWLADRLLARYTDCVLAVTESVREECARNRDVSLTKIVTLPNGIPLDAFEPLAPAKCRALRGHWNLPLSACVVGTITRLHEEKGTGYLLEAASRVLSNWRDARFVIVGAGPLLGQLEERARKLGIRRNVIFAGFRQDVTEMLSLFDIMVIPSVAEGHPQALLEAMAMRKAVVATGVGGIPGIMRNGDCGLLVPPRDPEALAEAILHLLRNKPERVRLATHAYAESRRYSLNRHVKNLESVYLQVSARRAVCLMKGV